MPWAPAEKNVTCTECVDIARELNEAYGDERLQKNSEGSTADGERTQAAAEAIRRLIGGTEEDAERADKLLNVYRYQASSYRALSSFFKQLSPEIVVALRRSLFHMGRTGHQLRKITG